MLAETVQTARSAYAQRLTSAAGIPWWDAVVVTAGSARQAARYNEEIRRRSDQGKIPPGVHYQVIPDPENERIGTLGATVNALAALAHLSSGARILMIHAGGDSRRLPQYSLSGKLFSPLPVTTPWGETATVFDELLQLSTAWAGCLTAGLVVASGDVLLTLDVSSLNWDRPGVSGVAIAQPVEMGAEHGVYIVGEEGRVYAYLQKPKKADIEAAGGLLPDNRVALDTGLMRFDPDLTRQLSTLRVSGELDLYKDLTMSLTGQTPALAEFLKGIPFHCDLAHGEFTHVGATPSFRLRMTEARQQVIDSLFTGGVQLAPGAIAIECDLDVPVRAARGAILHGLTGITVPVEAPEDTVVHQIPVQLPEGRKGTVIRVYGVEDDPRATPPTWFGLPMNDVLSTLGLSENGADESLWNACLFPVCDSPTEAWQYAQSLLGASGPPAPASRVFLSLSTSTQYADQGAVAAAQTKRAQSTWKQTALTLAKSGTDIRPLLAHAPGIAVLASVARDLIAYASSLSSRCEAASMHFQASRFYSQAGLTEDADRCRHAAFSCVQSAVSEMGRTSHDAGERALALPGRVSVTAPPRIDLGGGWSDTPPFCLDWGGTVLNIALELNGDYPIEANITRLTDPVVRLRAAGDTAEYRNSEELLAPTQPGDPFAIPKTALKMWGWAKPNLPLPGLEIETTVDLPMGSGLGTSSILAAAVLKAMAAIEGVGLSNQQLSDDVMRLEQIMTTGGGWQDQVGGIYPGIKLIASGPGLKQRLRVEQVTLTEEREKEFEDRFVLYYTGIRRIAKNLLAQVVGSYLAREVATVQVLHSIKTLAMEMAYALREGEWDYLGQLLDRHWELNKLLDPHTTNAPIEAMLSELRPYLAGAKLAGAGGGGFLLLLAKSPRAALALRRKLATSPHLPLSGAVYKFKIATGGMRVSAE